MSSVDEQIIDNGTFGRRLGFSLREEIRQILGFSNNMPRQPTQPMPFFDHGVNPREMSDKLPEPWHNHRNEPVWSEEFSFISAKRIKDFLTENVDEHADHFIFFTTTGTILGHDNTHQFPKCRRFGSFAGPTFRIHDEAFAKTGKPSTNKTINDGMFNGKVLKFIIEKGRSGLRAMIVEQEGVISAVVYCKQRTLMAAQLEKGKFERELADEGENLAREVGGMGLKDGDADATCDPNDGQATAATDHKDGDATPETDTTDKDKDPEASNGKAKKPEDVKPTKMLILQWRAEGMADEMANDELKDFIMPKDFH